MTDKEENNESVKKSEDLIQQPALPEIKMCQVQLEKINLEGYLYSGSVSNDSDSDEDLIPLPYSTTKSIKVQKSNKELLEEFKNLARNIEADNLPNSSIEDKVKTFPVVDTDEVENVSSSPSATIVSEEKDIKVFFVNDTLQFFNIGDITFEQCGYDSKNVDLTEYEKIMLSFKRVELERVLSSVLISCDIYCISDIKSFVTFLLRNLSVHTDVASVKACYDALIFILNKHPDAKTLNFSSAEIFMLLFNYGTDINSFKFLEKRMDIQSYLEEPKDKSRSKIPEKWEFNLKTTLNAIIVLITYCEFKLKHLCDIIIYFLWMSLDDDLLNENLFSTVRECINVSLEHVPQDKWSKVLREIACTFITEDFVHSQDQWRYVYRISESVPVISKRGIELRKYISFLALTQFGEIQSCSESPEQRVGVDKTLNGFSLYELQSLLKKLIQNGSDALVNFASKFLNICISYLGAPDEEFKQLCTVLKDAECVLSLRAYEAKARFCKIHSRLMQGRNSNFMVLTEDDGVLSKRIKKEVDIDKDPCSSYSLVKVKEEPGLEYTPYVMGHSYEKIISFSEFDCENEEELDFNNVYQSDNTGGIHMDIVSNAVNECDSIENSNNLLKNSFIKDEPVTSDQESSEQPISPPLPSESSSSDKQADSTKNAFAVEAEEIVPSEIASFPHVSENGSFSLSHNETYKILPESSENYNNSSFSKLSVENNNLNQNSSFSEKEVNDCYLPTLPPGVSVTPISNVNQSDLSSTSYNVESTSNIFTENNNLNQNSSFSEKEVNDCYLPRLPPGVSVTPISNVNQSDLLSTTYNVESTSNNFTENNNLNQNSSVSEIKVNDCYVPTLPPGVSVTPITNVNQSDLSSTSYNIENTSNNFTENNNMNQNSSLSEIKVNDCYVPTLPPGISVTPITNVNQSDLTSTSYNVESTSNNFPDKLNKTCNLLHPESSLGNSASVNSFNETSNDVEQNDAQLNPEAENYHIDLLEQPTGKGILPVEKKIDSLLPGSSKRNTNVDFEQCKTSNDKDVVIISEKHLPEKGKKKSNERVEAIESDGSDKELQILFVKPVTKRKTTLSKSFKEKSKHSKNKADDDTDDEVTVITENSEASQTCRTTIQSPSLSLTDSSYNAVNNRIIAVARENAKLPPIFKATETIRPAYVKTVSNVEIFMEHPCRPTKILHNVQLYTTPINNSGQFDNEFVNSQPKSAEIIQNQIFNHGDVNLLTSTTTADDIVLPNEKSISIAGNILPEDVDVSDMSVVNVGAETTLNQAALDIQSTASNGQESGIDKSCVGIEEPVKDGSDLTDSNIQEDPAIINSTIIELTSSQEDDKLNPNRNLLKENTPSMEVQSTLNSSRKINSKRKSISNGRNLLLHSHSTEHDDSKDITLLLNDVLESIQREDDMCESSPCTPTGINITEFNSSSTFPLSSVTSSSPHDLIVEPDLSSPKSIQQNIPDQVEDEEINPMCSESLKTDLVGGNNSEINVTKPDTLSDSNDGSLPHPNTSERPIVQSICKSEPELSFRVSEPQSPKKRKNSECSIPSPELQNGKDEYGPSSNKKLKSCANTKNTQNKNSQNCCDDHQKSTNIKKTSFKKEDILTQTGLKLSTVLRENLSSDSPKQIPSSSVVKVDSSSDSDSDILELYSDPRNYADQECMLIYDSQHIIVLDDSD